MQLSGFQVSIYSDGKQLEEHAIEISPDGKRATCWIPCKGGKEFVVRDGDVESSTNKDKAKSVHVFLDGQRTTTRVTLPNQAQRTTDGVYTTGGAKRPFVFTEIKNTDRPVEGTAVPGDNHIKADEIGIISVQVFLASNWYKYNSELARKSEVLVDQPPVAVNPNQRTKKAAEHCVSLGNEQPCPVQEVYYLGYDPKKPEMVFEFFYRSEVTLRALGIIPPPPPGTPSWFMQNIWRPLTPYGTLRHLVTWFGSRKA